MRISYDDIKIDIMGNPDSGRRAIELAEMAISRGSIENMSPESAGRYLVIAELLRKLESDTAI